MRFEKLFLTVITAPEIQRDKWQDKDKSARRDSRTHRSNPRFTNGHPWDPLRKIDATHQEESNKKKLNSTKISGKTGWGKNDKFNSKNWGLNLLGLLRSFRFSHDSLRTSGTVIIRDALRESRQRSPRFAVLS